MYRSFAALMRRQDRERHDTTMKTAMIVKSGLTAVAFLLITTGANAQTASTASQSTKAREGHSGMATGKYQRKAGAIHSADYGRKAKGGFQTTKPQEPSQDSKKGENPLYEDTGKSGNNPMYEGKRVHSQADGSGQQPGREARGQGAPLKGVGKSPTAAAQNKKHTAAVKYQNRQAAGQPADSPHE